MIGWLVEWYEFSLYRCRGWEFRISDVVDDCWGYNDRWGYNYRRFRCRERAVQSKPRLCRDHADA
jgi:hypothetical protein